MEAEKIDFRAFIRKFSPPLGWNDIDEIVTVHEKIVAKAVEQAKAEAKLTN